MALRGYTRRWLLCAALIAGVLAALSGAAPSMENNGYKEYDDDTKQKTVTGDYINRGTVKATASNGGTALQVTGGFYNVGTVTATGENYGYGIRLDYGSFYNSGAVNATGENIAYGIILDSGGFYNSGAVNATGSHSDDIFLNLGSFFNSGLVTLGGAAGEDDWSIYLAYGSMNFSSGSALALGGGNITVYNSASPLVVNPNTQLLAPLLSDGKTQEMEYHTFLENLYNLNGKSDYTVDDLYDAFNVKYNGPVLQYTIRETATDSKTYEVHMERVALASKYAQSGNAGSFTAQLEAALTGRSLDDYESDGTPGSDGWLGAYDTHFKADDPLYLYSVIRSYIDSQPTEAAVRSGAARMGRERTPQASAGVLSMLTDAARMPSTILSDNMFAAYAASSGGETAAQNALSASSGSAYANIFAHSDRALVVWGKPFYHYGRYDAAQDSGYSNLTENIGGMSFGAAMSRGDFTYAASAHYIHANIEGGADYNSHANGYGITVGASRAIPLAGFCPRLSFTVGYTHYEWKQWRTPSFLPSKAASDPNLNVYTATLSLSDSYEWGRVCLKPSLGLNYAHTRMPGYHESGNVLSMPMRVDAGHVNSLRGILGAKAQWNVSNRVTLEARGEYRYEFADRRASLTWNDTSGTIYTFTTEGRDAGRHSGVMGTGVRYRHSDRVSLALDYDFQFARRYNGHRVSATVGVGF